MSFELSGSHGNRLFLALAAVAWASRWLADDEVTDGFCSRSSFAYEIHFL